jgi:hypothetical protein
MHRRLPEDEPPDAQRSDLTIQKMAQVGDGLAPAAPLETRDTGVDPAVLSDLALRAAYTVPQFNTEWAARRLHLPQPVVGELLEQLRTDSLLDVLGSAGPFGFRYSISSRGRERAGRLLEVTSYAGPAPVSLEAYSEMLEWQVRRLPEVTPDRVASSLSGLVLEPEERELAGLAASSGRSLFVFGPPGNGKTTLGRSLHEAREGDLWIPYCINIEGSFIRLFDPQCHQRAGVEPEPPQAVDRRWVKIRRPLIVVGGEMTLDSCDLTYSRSLRYYEAPLHMKANGGTFLIDDFGRQRVDPHEFLNRWIIPLEHHFDYLTLQTGQKIHVPFMLMLIVATNLDVGSVTDPAFLRRMGYRLYLDQPSPERYTEIFQRYATQCGVAAPSGLVNRLLDRYRVEGRQHRGCEPRDLIERARDICRYRRVPLELTEELLDLAWSGFFGSGPPDPPS